MSGHPYTDSDIGRIQQEAVARMREMQERTRKGEDFPGPGATSRNRNWSTNPNVQRQSRVPRQPPEESKKQDPPRSQPFYSRHGESAPPDWRDPPGREPPPHYDGRRDSAPQPAPRPDSAKKDTTVLQDILGAIGLDDDRILILGLILILINDKADTTLILALCYLLI